VGVAISLSQSVGIHRDPGCSRIHPSQRALWRRLWWCCFSRDRSLALGMGRPCRIYLEDCNVGDLTLEDLIHHGTTSELKGPSAAVVRQCNYCSPIFIELIKLTRLLSDVLEAVYRPRASKFPGPTSWTTAQMIQEKLCLWQLGLDPCCRLDAPTFSIHDSVAMIRHKHYLQILYQYVLNKSS
jgi:hypothetical protein